MNKRILAYLFGGLFLVIGVLITVTVVMDITGWNRYRKVAYPVKATIENIEERTVFYGRNSSIEYTVYFNYDVEGKTYKKSMHFHKPSMVIGGQLTVYIDKNNPNTYRLSPAYTIEQKIVVAVILLAAGFTFVILGKKLVFVE